MFLYFLAGNLQNLLLTHFFIQNNSAYIKYSPTPGLFHLNHFVTQHWSWFLPSAWSKFTLKQLNKNTSSHDKNRAAAGTDTVWVCCSSAHAEASHTLFFLCSQAESDLNPRLVLVFLSHHQFLQIVFSALPKMFLHQFFTNKHSERVTSTKLQRCGAEWKCRAWWILYRGTLFTPVSQTNTSCPQTLSDPRFRPGTNLQCSTS